MNLPGPNLSARSLTAIAVTLALALPSAAAAQDPSADQYTPTAPSGGGSEPVSPVPSSGGGDGGAPPADSGSSGGSGSADPADTGGTAPSDSTESAPVDPVNASASSGEAKKQHKDDRTLDGLAATASAERAGAGAGSTEGPATELLRSESGGGLGMGIMLWAVLGVTALWAIATVVRRRQDGNGHPA